MKTKILIALGMAALLTIAIVAIVSVSTLTVQTRITRSPVPCLH